MKRAETGTRTSDGSVDPGMVDPPLAAPGHKLRHLTHGLRRGLDPAGRADAELHRSLPATQAATLSCASWFARWYSRGAVTA